MWGDLNKNARVFHSWSFHPMVTWRGGEGECRVRKTQHYFPWRNCRVKQVNVSTAHQIWNKTPDSRVSKEERTHRVSKDPNTHTKKSNRSQTIPVDFYHTTSRSQAIIIDLCHTTHRPQATTVDLYHTTNRCRVIKIYFYHTTNGPKAVRVDFYHTTNRSQSITVDFCHTISRH